MEEFLSAFHFLRPWWLLAAAVPLAGCFRFFARDEERLCLGKRL